MTPTVPNTIDSEPSSVIEDLEAARSGDVDAFGRLVAPIEERLYRQAYLLCRNESIAEDLAQNTLVSAWKGLYRFDGRCRLFTWLYAILLNTHKKHLRTQARKPLIFWGLFQWNRDHPEARAPESTSSEHHPEAMFAQKERNQHIATLINTLSPKHQEVIRLRFYAEASLEEIAETTGCSIGTVKSRLHYALEKLREKNFAEGL